MYYLKQTILIVKILVLSLLSFVANVHAEEVDLKFGGFVKIKGEQGDHPDDECWKCVKCHNLLAVQDTSTGKWRIHYQALNVKITPTAGCVLDLDCRRCGATNIWQC